MTDANILRSCGKPKPNGESGGRGQADTPQMLVCEGRVLRTQFPYLGRRCEGFDSANGNWQKCDVFQPPAPKDMKGLSVPALRLDIWEALCLPTTRDTRQRPGPRAVRKNYCTRCAERKPGRCSLSRPFLTGLNNYSLFSIKS